MSIGVNKLVFDEGMCGEKSKKMKLVGFLVGSDGGLVAPTTFGEL